MLKKWWHNKVAYQIYPKSFMDSNGDGIGDIPGITSRLDYLKDLGVDILWICPVYESPFVDQGYDISDYYKIADCFGTMEDFDRLIGEAKKRGMYVIMDLVINHCSDRHEWFQKALAAPEGEYAERFYFEKGRDGREPSNYRSYFGGNMWEKVPGKEDLYYLHSFAKQQPDLNWNNEYVLNYLYDMVNWWLDKGVAGFRVDAIINIRKNTEFPSYEADGPDGLCSVDKVIEGAAKYDKGPDIGEMLQDLKKNTFDRKEAFTVGEVFNMQEDELTEFIGENGHFSTIFDFCLHILTNCESGWYAARKIIFSEMRQTIFDSQLATQHAGFMANIIENHDEPRGISVFLPEWIDKQKGAKLFGTVMLLLHGIPFIYQGQEIGMTNKEFKSLDEYNDIYTIDQYRQAVEHGFTHQDALKLCALYSRDNARTPMQWSSEPEAGFTTGKPWFVVNPNYKEINVAAQENDEASVLNYYKELIALRKTPEYEDAFVYGEFEPAYQEYENILAYYRRGDSNTILVISNWGSGEQSILLKKDDSEIKILLDNMYKSGSQYGVDVKPDSIKLLSGQAVVLKIQ